MRYASIVVATNWAAGMQEKVSHEEVEAMMDQSSLRIRKLIERAIGSS
jgi:purine nucleoside phosphorylase